MARILQSCSGYAGFIWPWLLAAGPRRQENAKTRVDRRSMRDFALYRCFGRTGLCRGQNPAFSSCSGYDGLRPWLFAAVPQRQDNAKARVDPRSSRNFALYRGFGCAGLCWPESCISVPATLVFGLGCLQRRRGARKTEKRA